MAPSAITLPSCSTVTLRAISSMKAMSCSTTTSECLPASESKSSAVLSVSSSVIPATGSSSSRSCGSCISSIPISSHCFCPCDNIPARRRASGSSLIVSRELEILEHRVPLEHGRLLELAADAGVGDLGLGHLGEIDRLPEEGAPGVGLGLAGDDIHHRRLAGAVRPDHAAQFAHIDQQRQVVQRPESVEAHTDAVEVQDALMRRVEALGIHPGPRSDGAVPMLLCGAHDALLRQSLSPASPRGRNSVTRMNSSPSANSQYSGNALVNQLLPRLTAAAPNIGPTSVPRPPTAVQIAISIELAGDISLGLMIPTCGT